MSKSHQQPLNKLLPRRQLLHFPTVMPAIQFWTYLCIVTMPSVNCIRRSILSCIIVVEVLPLGVPVLLHRRHAHLLYIYRILHILGWRGRCRGCRGLPFHPNGFIFTQLLSIEPCLRASVNCLLMRGKCLSCLHNSNLMSAYQILN